MRFGRCLSMLVVFVQSAAVAAQSVSGSAEWGYTRSTVDSGESEAAKNGSFVQGYTVAYRSALWSPRFLTYLGEVNLRHTSLDTAGEEGRLGRTGYKFAANLFPGRPMQASVYTARGSGIQRGTVPFLNPLTGGLASPDSPGAPSEFNTRDSQFGVQWSLVSPALPSIRFGYDKNVAAAITGPAESSQRNSSLVLDVTKASSSLRQSLRYQRVRSDNALSQVFTNRVSDLTYDLWAGLSPKLSATVRAGRRSTFSLVEGQNVRQGDGATGELLARRGGYDVTFAASTLSYQAGPRFGAIATASYNNTSYGDVRADSLLFDSSARVEPFRGLTLTGRLRHGRQAQLVQGESVDVLTRGVGGDVSYRFPFRIVRLGLAAGRGFGWNRDALGRPGNVRSRRYRADASTRVYVVDLSAGYQQERAEDDLLPVGNRALDRVRATARSRPSRRLTLEAAWERSSIEQGLDASFTAMTYRALSLAGTFEITPNQHLTLTAGQMESQLEGSTDRTAFAGLSWNAQLTRTLRLTTDLRSDVGRFEAALFDRAGFYLIQTLEYRLRLFVFGLEYRLSTLELDVDRGRKPFGTDASFVMVRVTRRFGFGF